jgi:tetratricopeptide (TPR) repeat protein
MLKKRYCLLLFATLAAWGAVFPAFAQNPEGPQKQTLPVSESALLQGVQDYRIGNYEEALDELTKARAQEPQSSAAAYYLGATLNKMQRFEEAVPHLKDATSGQPPANEAFLELADAYCALQRTDEALLTIEVCEREGLAPGRTAFLKGLALMQKRTYPEALASFEAAKTAAPELGFAADFQIATIYHRLGKSTEARNLFTRIAEGDPESDIGYMARQQSDVLTTHMTKRKAFSALANVQYQSDSNVILKPDNSSSAGGISNKSDTAAVLSLQAGYDLPLDLPYGVKFQYSGYANFHNELKDYDLQRHTFGVSPSYRIGENTASLPISYNDTLVDGSRYLSVFAVAPTYTFVTGEHQYTLASVTYQNKEFPQTTISPEENRTGTSLGAGISWFRLVAQQKGFTNLKYEFSREKTDGANWSMQENKVGAGFLYPVSEHVQLALGVEAFRQAFDNVNVLFGKKRTDTGYTVNAQILYALTQMVDAQLQYVLITNDSNVDVYTYHKNIFGVGLYAKF